MTTEDKDSLVEMLSKIPITETRGSLLSAISKLLRIIDISESSIMIPTLLKDKCEFDAHEMLTLAKILKASILGHNDLVEFYLSESSSQLNSFVSSQHQQLSITNKSSSTATSRSTSTTSSQNQYNNNNHNIINNNHTNSNINNNNNNNNAHNHNHLQLNHNHNHLLLLRSTTPSLRSSSTSESTNSSPSTPMPQAETLGVHNPLQLNNGDPDATVRLLLQIEQLKTFIPQVTGLFEGIVELYKNSVDTITYQTARSHK